MVLFDWIAWLLRMNGNISHNNDWMISTISFNMYCLSTILTIDWVSLIGFESILTFITICFVNFSLWFGPFDWFDDKSGWLDDINDSVDIDIYTCLFGQLVHLICSFWLVCVINQNNWLNKPYFLYSTFMYFLSQMVSFWLGSFWLVGLINQNYWIYKQYFFSRHFMYFLSQMVSF